MWESKWMCLCVFGFIWEVFIRMCVFGFMWESIHVIGEIQRERELVWIGLPTWHSSMSYSLLWFGWCFGPFKSMFTNWKDIQMHSLTFFSILTHVNKYLNIDEICLPLIKSFILKYRTLPFLNFSLPPMIIWKESLKHLGCINGQWNAYKASKDIG